MKTLVLTFQALLLLSVVTNAQTLDTVIFGNTTSESSHSLTAYFPPATNITTVSWQNTPAPSDPSSTPPSDVVSGGLGLSARRLLPRTPEGDVYGGQMTFTMAVDPVKQNFFTIKMWGSDPNGGIYLILNCDGKEIGLRHGGGGIAEDPLWAGATGWFANRFFYRTEPLPLSMTRGKTTVTLTVRSLGSIFDYAPIFTYVPQYQSVMRTPSESIYAAYTHAGALFDSSSETQGTVPPVQTPRAVETEASSIAGVEVGVNAILSQDMLASPTSLGENDADVLATIYDARVNTSSPWIVYPNGLADADLGKQVIAILDGVVSAYASNTSLAGANWGGNFGPMGDAIRLTWPLISNSMSTTVNYGGSLGATTRKAAWAAALRASVDDGRYGRQTIAGQALANAGNIWYANAGLLLVDSTRALKASESIRYMREASGVQPWLGNDQATGGTDGMGGGPVPTYGLPPYGPNWYMCTTKGTTKDGDGFVGSDYGEVGPSIYRMGLISGDAQLQARGIVMTRTRNIFRYPGPDESGYLMMMGTEPIGVRNNDLPGHYVYLGRGFSDDFLMASQGAAAIGADLMGHLQEQINDGQAYRFFYYQDPYLPSRWATIKAQAQTNQLLPMAVGQPDFAWVDEQNMVVAAKHGEERFYANLYWRQPGYINGLAKVFDLTPTLARLGDVMVDEVRFRSTGQTITTNGSVDGFATPPDNPQEAFAGLPMSLAYRSDLSAVPAVNRDAGRGTGYTLRYGNWLVGINADYSATYNVKLPSNFTSALDLISGQTMSGPITLAPQTSVVFYLTTTTDPSPTPARSLYTAAVGTNGGISVTWANAGAAATYNLLRSTTSGSGYTTIASGLTAAGYLDTNVTAGTTYYYVVTSVNSIGVSGYSPEASATPVAPETANLPAPWTDFDESGGTGGSVSISGGTFTLISGTSVHTVYQILSGDGAVTARLQSQTNSSGGAFAGVVMRDNLLADPTTGSMVLRPGNLANFNYTGADGGGPWGFTYGSNISAPYWVRVVRTDLTITGFISPDGHTWTAVSSYSYAALPYNLYVGLFVNSGSGQSNTAVFTNVTLPLGATAAPSAPTGLTTLYSGTTSASLSWTESPGAAGYNVKRSTSAGGPFSTIAAGVVTNSYTDYGLVNGVTYYYVVSAVNSLGESANSSVSTAALLPPPGNLSGFTVSASGTQALLSWATSSGASSYVISRATTYAGPYTVIASWVTATNYADTGLTANTLYYYKVIPVNSAGNGTGSIISAVTGLLPAPWQTQDIGLNVPGAAYASNGVFTLLGNGSGGYGSSTRYVYQSLTGDGAITIRVTGQANANNNQTGVMIRDSADTASRYVYLDLTSTASNSQVNWEYRSAYAGGISSSFGGVTSTLPCWLRAVRFGNSVALYLSSDAQHWTPYTVANFAMNSTVMIGMATSSGDLLALNTATIDNVSVTAGLPGGGAATASSANPPSESAAQAFDDNISTKWYDPVVGGTGYLKYQFPGGASYLANQYQISSANDVPQRDPAAWIFQGSNDGVNWTTLDTQTSQVFANRYQANVYNITNTTAYQYYQLNITANAGGGAYGIQLSELGLYGLNAGASIIAPSAPLDLSVSWSSGQIALNWQPPFSASGYNVKRSTTSGGPYTTLASALTATSFIDTTVTNGTTYYYVVSAINAGGESVSSVENSATPIGSLSAAVSPTPFLTGQTAGSTRNNYAGFVGMQFTVGAAPISVTALGRFNLPGNSQTHTVKLVNAQTGVDVAGASAQVTMTSASAGTYQYANLPATIQLNAFTSYFLVSQETYGGDMWYDYNKVSSTTDASIIGPVYGTTAGSYVLVSVPPPTNWSYVPANFEYTAGTPTAPPTVAVTQPANNATVTGTLTVAATASTTAPLTVAGVQFQLNGAPIGAFVTAAPFQITVNTENYPDGAYSLTAVAVDSSSNSAISAAVNASFSNGTVSVASPFVTEETFGAIRNNYTGFVGMEFTVGSQALTVNALGRMFISGNSRTHTLKLVNVSTGQDVAGSLVQLAMTGGTAQQFKYQALTTPLTLPAGSSYCLVSQETVGGDQWYDYGAVTVTNVASVPGSVYQSSTAYMLVPFTNSSYVPLSFLYGSSTSSTNPTPTSNAPTVSVTSPSAGAVTGTVTFTAQASAAAGLQIVSLQLVLDGSKYGPVGASATLSESLATTSLSNGTHILTAVAIDSSGQSTTSAAVSITVSGGTPVTTAPLLTGQSLQGSLRSNFTGSVGLQFTTGTAALTVTQLGRYCATGNSQAHAVKLVQSNGTDLPGGSVSVSMAGCAVGQYVYSSLSSALTLAPGTTYELVSIESSGGDQWYDYSSVTVSLVVTVPGPVYQTGSSYVTVPAPSYSYVPVNLQYQTAAVAPVAPAISITAPAASSTVSGAITLSATATASTGLSIASVQFQENGTNLGKAITGSGPLFTAQLDTTTLLNSQYRFTAIATDSAGNITTSAAVAVTVSNAGGSAGSPFITQQTFGPARNNFSGLVGMEFTINSTITVTQLGRICVAGNTGSHLLKLVSGNGTDVTGGSVSIAMSSCSVGQYQYAALPSSLNLTAGTYYLMAREASGGDQWFDIGPVTSAIGSVVGPVYVANAYNLVSLPGYSYGPYNFLFGATQP